ncbi:hypothetical protein M9H77_25442 [Catharanthus roseus]|uniref:Uncharacterized protein n=1 Tax=Catharanthus roseus TaxID=4058 RepID=A0ACC0A754_CATRO|nr:hypothetical protein M9H77_25442 [Catharanthus roseus]
MHYLWTILPHHAKEGIHILIEFEHIQKHSILITQDINTTNMTEHITAVTQIVSDEPSMLYTTVNDDNDEVDQSDGDDTVSSKSESNDDNDPEEGELQTPVNPVNPVTENRMPQWESSQWFSSARYRLGFSIDDLVESCTIRLLDWNDSTTDIQLGMRFLDKVQAISAVRKWSISVGGKYRVMKSKNDTWTTRFTENGKHIYCLVFMFLQCVEKMGQEQILMCRRYIRDKCTKELTKRIFIRS